MPHRLSNNIKEALKKTYASELGRWIMSAFVSFFILGILFLLFRPVFMTIDDPRVRYVYAGYAAGEPVGNYLFCNVILGSAIAGLYKLAPGIPWYVIYHILLIGLSSGAIGKTIYKFCYKKGITANVAVFIHIATYLALSIISTIMMHFEITAVMTGTVAIVLLLGISDEDRRSSQYFDIVFSSFFLFVTFLIAKNNLYAICCYLLVIFVYHLLHMIYTRKKKVFVRLVVIFIPLTVAGIALAFFCNNMAKKTDEWQKYLSYNKYRVSYWDYPHVTYDENPDLFEEIGWTENFYKLAEDMYFLDERFNEDALASFCEPFSWFNYMGKDEMLENVKSSVSSLYKKEPVVVFQTVLAVITFLLIVRFLYLDKNRKKNASIYISLLCNFGGTIILMGYLAIRARFPLRVWLSCFIPFEVINIIQLLRLYGIRKRESDGNETQYAAKRLLRTLLATFCCFFFLNAFKDGILDGYNYRNRLIERLLTVENYCIDNEEKVYIYEPNFIQNYSALSEYKNAESGPVNMLAWGSSYIYTPAFYQQLKYLGYETFSTENLFDENIYIITNNTENKENKLFVFLEEEYPGFGYEVVDWIMDDCAVYKLYKG